MTVALYARRKGWPLQSVSVRLQHAKIHAADCAECETKEGKLDRIEVELILTGVLSDEQRTRLLDIANRCPVHRTLTSEIDIRSRLG
jgi:putative redox protein